MDFSNATLRHVSVHFVGNKGNGQEMTASKSPLQLEDHHKKLMTTAMLERFATDTEKYAFHNPVALDYCEMYNFCLQLFAGDADFQKTTLDIAKHLYESSTHPKIKAGDLYVCHFDNCAGEGNIAVEAIGIYKTETKTNFIDLENEGHNFELHMREGTELTRLDKGCLIMPTNAEQGFDVLLFDSNRGEEAQFWKETFLSIVPQANEYFQTNQFLTLTKQFIAKQLPTEFDMEKTEQIDLLNKSVEYFRANESFDKKGFEEAVLQEDGLISAFRRYGDTYAEMNDVDIPDSFGISTQAVKKQARVFKSVLKLDKNFHIYIHGDKDLIEKGYDETVGKSFYKIYFDEEE